MSSDLKKNYKKDEFEQIVDPETNRLVPIDSAVGQQVVKNYLTVMSGGSEEDLISTKKFYTDKSGVGSSSSSKRPSTASKSKLASVSENSKSGGSKSENKGEFKGICPVSKKPIYSTDPRVKIDGKYYHEAYAPKK